MLVTYSLRIALPVSFISMTFGGDRAAALAEKAIWEAAGYEVTLTETYYS